MKYYSLILTYHFPRLVASRLTPTIPHCTGRAHQNVRFRAPGGRCSSEFSQNPCTFSDLVNQIMSNKLIWVIALSLHHVE